MNDATAAESWKLLAIVSAALLLPPLVPAVALPFLTPLVAESSPTSLNPAEMMFFYLAALSVNIAFAMPSFLVLRRLKLVRWWSACLVGAAIGGSIALALGGSGAFEFTAPAWAATGVLSALVFWLVANVAGRRDAV